MDDPLKTERFPSFKLFLTLLLPLLTFNTLNEMHQRRVIDLRISGGTPDRDFVIPMAYRDKQRLEAFLRHYCIFEQWIYTLSGVKPASISACHTTTQFFNPFSRRRERLLGWNTWLNCQPYFRDSRFAVFSDKGWQSDGTFYIAIVDKLQLGKIVLEHPDDFQRALDTNGSDIEQWLQRTREVSFFEDILLGHDGLIGTVLGYGRNNAWQFFDRSQGKEILLTSLWDEELMDQMLHLWNRKPLLAPWDLSHLFYPSCAADRDSEESISLRKRYQEARDLMIRYYEGRDFVEATLSLLNGFRPSSKSTKTASSSRGEEHATSSALFSTAEAYEIKAGLACSF